jgi:ATP-dependent exoDNAse (exonuclease V) beta subunit
VYPDDVKAFLSILEKRPFAIPDASIHELLRERARSFVVMEALSEENLVNLSDTDVRIRLSWLREALEVLDERRSYSDLTTFVTEAMEYTQYFYHLFQAGADLHAVASVSKRVFELVENVTQRNERNLAAVLEAIQTLLDRKQFDEDDAPYFPEGRVKIMTIHQAKGLQFPAVAVPGIKSLHGGSDGFHLVKDKGLFVSDKDNMPGRGMKESGVADRLKAEDEQEARCIFYVAVTRAKDHLFLSSPFPNGIEGKKENFMASVLRAVKAYGIGHVEWRATPDIATTIPDNDEVGTVDLSALIDEWEAGRERIRESQAAAGRAPEGLQFVSWRALYAFSRCPLQYYYRYVAGISDELLAREFMEDDDGPAEGGEGVPDGMSPEEFGSFVHRFFYEWVRSGAADPARSLLENLADRFGLKGEARRGVLEAAFDLAEAFRKRMPWKSEDVEKMEWPVQTRVGNLICHGVIDRVDRTAEGVRIIDYKVGLPRDEYQYQVQFYAWLASRLLEQRPVSAMVAYLRGGAETVPADVSSGVINSIEANAERLEEALQSATYHAAPGVACGSCDFKGICPHAVS